MPRTVDASAIRVGSAMQRGIARPLMLAVLGMSLCLPAACSLVSVDEEQATMTGKDKNRGAGEAPGQSQPPAPPSPAPQPPAGQPPGTREIPIGTPMSPEEWARRKREAEQPSPVPKDADRDRGG